MKILVIGGGKGTGKDVVDYFAPNSKNVSLSTGYNIRNPNRRREIAEMSLEYEAVLNHAYCGEMSQYMMLRQLYNHWKDADHEGYIFHTGTYSTYSINWDPDSNYTDMKKASDELLKKMSKKCENNKHKFRCTNLRPAMLDTPKSRLKPHWEGTGVTGEDFAKIIEFLFNNVTDGLCVPEIVLSQKHDPL